MVAVPLAGRVGLTEPKLAAQRQAPEEGRVVDVEADRGALAERPRRAVGKGDRERAALESRERPLEDRAGDPVEHPEARRRFDPDGGHGRTDPLPGTNAGLWWNGTRFSHSRRACQWMSAITCSGISG